MPTHPRDQMDLLATPMNITDQLTGLQWSRNPAPNMLTWDAGASYCEAIGPGWRLPTAIELVTIIDLTGPMAGAPSPFTPFSMGPNDITWSSSRNSVGEAVALNPSLRDFAAQPTTNLNTVRCVRSTESAPVGPRFSVDGGVFFDVRTRWAWRPRGTFFGQAAAATACASLDGGWRLPRVSEATSLLRFPGPPPHHVVPVPVNNSWWTSDPVPSTPSVFAVQANNAFLMWVDPMNNTFEALCINPSP